MFKRLRQKTILMVLLTFNMIFRKWYYYFLTETGVNYLREFLHLPADVVPDTQKVTPAVYKYFNICN